MEAISKSAAFTSQSYLVVPQLNNGQMSSDKAKPKVVQEKDPR